MCKATETFAPIAPTDGWHRFESEAEAIEYLQKEKIGLLPKTADTLRPIIYRGVDYTQTDYKWCRFWDILMSILW